MTSECGWNIWAKCLKEKLLPSRRMEQAKNAVTAERLSKKFKYR